MSPLLLPERCRLYGVVDRLVQEPLTGLTGLSLRSVKVDVHRRGAGFWLRSRHSLSRPFVRIKKILPIVFALFVFLKGILNKYS
jgi:hypothetical protein